MTPAPLDLPIIWKGALYGPVTFTWFDQTGNPSDLTGWTAIVKSRNLTFTVAYPDRQGGVVTISLNQALTSTLKLQVEQWSWVWVDPTGIVYPPFFIGDVEIKQLNYTQAIPDIPSP